VRVAIIAESPWHLAESLQRIQEHVRNGNNPATCDDVGSGIVAGVIQDSPRLVALFPGQGTHRLNMGEHLLPRFPFVRQLNETAGGHVAPMMFRDLLGASVEVVRQWEAELRETRTAQPAIVLSSIAILEVLAFFGLTPSVSIGHSLGEITALHAAGAFDATTAVQIAAARGAAMSDLNVPDAGAMLAIAAGPHTVLPLLAPFAQALAISNYNSPRQTVVSGKSAEIARLHETCAAAGLRSWPISVSHAFHSDIVAPAARTFRDILEPLAIGKLKGRCISTSLGTIVDPDRDLKELMAEHTHTRCALLRRCRRPRRKSPPCGSRSVPAAH
jgi:enediyne polyketide synthase